MRPLEHLEMLHSLSLRMARARSEREVGQAVVTELTNLIDHHACRFYLLSEAGDVVVPVAHDGVIAEYEDDRTADLVCRVGEGVAGRAVVDARARRIPDAAADAHAVDVPGSDPIDESMMVAPMLAAASRSGRSCSPSSASTSSTTPICMCSRSWPARRRRPARTSASTRACARRPRSPRR